MVNGHRSNAAVCRCGETTLELAGDPILSTICYCESCRTAARGFERDLGAPPTVNADGGVDYCLYRKDRVKIAQGAGHLREYRLKPDSPTRRVVASCCGSPMFVDFTPGHWLTIFRGRLSGQAPEPQMQVMTRDRPEGAALPDAIPAYDTMPPRFMIKLVAAWAAMGFRRPKIAW
ncbi:MAG TPA: hypothetical protein VHZ26_00840 [Caulobacteraceae bacterium]|jgi:hypothetical protein|nr:hypothetical protein [Caulobacteraceae bacterium]